MMAFVASTPEQRNENINVSKYFISSSGDRTHNHEQIFYSHTLCPCATTGLRIYLHEGSFTRI